MRFLLEVTREQYCRPGQLAQTRGHRRRIRVLAQRGGKALVQARNNATRGRGLEPEARELIEASGCAIHLFYFLRWLLFRRPTVSSET